MHLHRENLGRYASHHRSILPIVDGEQTRTEGKPSKEGRDRRELRGQCLLPGMLASLAASAYSGG